MEKSGSNFPTLFFSVTHRQTELHRVRFKVTGKTGHSDRKMPAQPNVFKGNDGKVSRYNLRKFAELPFHLIGSARTLDLCDHVLFNYYWLHAKISAVPILNILEDFTRALTLIHDPPLRRQVILKEFLWEPVKKKRLLFLSDFYPLLPFFSRLFWFLEHFN